MAVKGENLTSLSRECFEKMVVEGEASTNHWNMAAENKIPISHDGKRLER